MPRWRRHAALARALQRRRQRGDIAPVLGQLSDKYGRRPVLLLSLLGAAVDYVIMATTPILGILYIGRIISGITGASITTASAYIADISTDEDRAKNFGMIG